MAFLPSLTREARETLLDMLEKGELTDLTIKGSNSKDQTMSDVSDEGGNNDAEEEECNDGHAVESSAGENPETHDEASVQCICAECGKTFSSTSKSKYSVPVALSLIMMHHLDLHLLQD